MDIYKWDSLFLGLCATALVRFYSLTWLYKRKPRSAKKVGTVTGLWYYPVKSCRGIALQSALCKKEGPRPPLGKVGDRTLMVVQEDGKYLTMRQCPKMTFIQISVHGNKVQLEAPGMPPIKVPIDPVQRIVYPDCRLSTESLKGLDLGDEAAKWLTSYCGMMPLRLVYSDEGLKRRQPDKPHPVIKALGVEERESRQKAAYVDFACYHLLAEESLADLNSRLASKVTVANFRPNILIAGSEPFEEDKWDQIFIRNVRFTNYAECPRCLLTTVDHEKGQLREDNEPLNTLRDYRRLPKTKTFGPALGRYMFADTEGTISIGNDVFAVTFSDL